MSDENGQVPPDAIGAAPQEDIANNPAARPDPLSRDPILDQRLGTVGRHIGGGGEKAGNIAYIVIVAAIIVLVIAAIVLGYADNEKAASVADRIVTGCFALITGALGYLFGRSGSD